MAEALNGKRVPSWPIVRDIVEFLGGDEAEFHALWAADAEAAAAAGTSSTEDDDFQARYRRQVAAYHGQLAIPDPDNRRALGIGQLFVMPTITSLERVDVRKVDLGSIFDESAHIVLLGGPGSGKSAICSWLMYQHALDGNSRLPFLVPLREFAGGSKPTRSVVGFIELQLGAVLQCPAPQGAVSGYMEQGAALVMFDGLDEVSDPLRSDVTSVIEAFCSEFPEVWVLVTSRVAGYSRTQLKPHVFATYRLEDFDDDQVGEYVRRWFSGTRLGGSADDSLRPASEFLQDTANLADVRSTPLLLAMMCAVYQETGSAPRSLADLYGRTATLLVERVRSHHQSYTDQRAQYLVVPLLRHIAFWLFSEKDPPFAATKQELIAEVSRYLSARLEVHDDVVNLTQELVDPFDERASILREVGTTTQGEPLYAFLHLTLLEYFAAAHIVATTSSPEQLAKRLARYVDEPWASVSKLALLSVDRQVERGGERVVKTWLDGLDAMPSGERVAWQDFLAQCAELVYLPPSLMRQLARTVNPDQPATTADGVGSSQAGESDDVGFRGPAACQLAGITYRQLDYWARTGLVAPSIRRSHGSGSQRLYSFSDVLVLRIIKRLLDSGVLLQNIRVAVQHLRARRLVDLQEVTLFSDGKHVYETSSPDEVVELLQGGQGVFGISVSGAIQEINSMVEEFPAERPDGSQVVLYGPSPNLGGLPGNVPSTRPRPSPRAEQRR